MKMIYMPKWTDTIKNINRQNDNMTKISRATGINYSWTTNIIREMTERKYITTKKKGRQTLIILTKKGEKIKDLLQKLGEETK